MESGREFKIIATCMLFALLLMGTALFTVGSSFAVDANNDKSNWKVFFGEAEIKNNQDGVVSVSNETINFTTELGPYNEEFRFMTSINNEGTYDAYLESIVLSDLRDIVVGKSVRTGNIYTAADYVSFQVINSVDNSENEIVRDTAVKSGDLLNMGSSNILLVSVKMRSRNTLGDDKLTVLEENGNKIKLDLNVSVLYQQKK